MISSTVNTPVIDHAASQASEKQPAKRLSDALVIAIDILVFAAWLGGLVTIGAVTASVAFMNVRHAAMLAASPRAQNLLAGSIVGGCLAVYNVAALVAGLWFVARMIWLGIESAAADGKRLPSYTWLAVPAVLSLWVTATLMLQVEPRMDHAQRAGIQALFSTLHHAYVLAANVQIGLIVATVIGYAWLTSRKVVA